MRETIEKQTGLFSYTKNGTNLVPSVTRRLHCPVQLDSRCRWALACVRSNIYAIFGRATKGRQRRCVHAYAARNRTWLAPAETGQQKAAPAAECERMRCDQLYRSAVGASTFFQVSTTLLNGYCRDDRGS